jgi:serine O-acetyltransferase
MLKRTDSPSLLALLRADLRRYHLLSRNDKPSSEPIPTYWHRLMTPIMMPVLFYRVSHAFYLRGHLRLAKLVASINLIMFGIEIASRCPIGPGLLLAHTHGTVIGAWRIGANCTIFQGVTLGAKELDFSYTSDMRPSVGDNVIIGAGAKILGGVEVSDGSTIGANAVVLRSVPAGMLALGVPAVFRLSNPNDSR